MKKNFSRSGATGTLELSTQVIASPFRDCLKRIPGRSRSSWLSLALPGLETKIKLKSRSLLLRVN